MSDSLRSALAAAVVRILRPLVRTVLRGGLSYTAFDELVRWVFVDVAMREFGIPGRKNSKSRVAVLTGLTRREVDRLVRLPEPKEGTPERYNRAARVLSGWAEDPQFLDAEGQPRVLPLEGPHSFSEVVRLYSGNTPPRAVLDELERVGSVERIDGDHVRLLKPYYEPVSGKQEEEKLNILGIAAGDLLETISHNIRRDAGTPSFYQQEIYERFPSERLPALRRLLARHCDQFADRSDRVLLQQLKAEDESKGGTGTKRVGVGVYYFETDWDSN